MAERDWSAINLTGDPRLLLGRRKSSKRIVARRADVHEGLFDDLRTIAQSALDELVRREAKAYSSFAAISGDDYFDVDVTDIPQRRDRRKQDGDPEAHQIADALKVIAETDLGDPLNAEELRTLDFTLYAIVFEDQGEYIGFVRNVSPRRRIKPGLRYLQYGDALKKVEPPDLAIDDEIDLVVTKNHCAVLAPSAFITLFGDVGLAFRQVPANLTVVATALKETLPLAPDSHNVLTERCGRRVIDARRLHFIATERSAALGALSVEEITSLMTRRGLDEAIRDGSIHLNHDSVSDFLDIIEGRLYNDDVTNEERRADAYSPRRTHP